MSGGFFRGTSADQDTRFSNKQAKLLKSQKFAPELDHLVDMTKVKMDVIRPWIATRATELLGFEDEVLINFVYGLLDGKEVDGKQIQIQLTGFMEKNTGKFMKELWSLLLSAQNNVSGVPQQFLEAKEEETRKKKAETDRIAQEIQKRRDIDGRESGRERKSRFDGEADSKFTTAASDSVSKFSKPRASSVQPEEDKEADGRHGSRAKNGLSRSPPPNDHSRSPSRIVNSPTRSNNKSISRSRSYSEERHKSRSLSVSSQPPRHSVSPRRRYLSPERRSPSPKRRYRSPPRRSVSPRRRRSISPRRRHSPRGTRSPSRRRSPPLRRRSRSRHRSPSPFRYRSPMSRRRSPRRRSPSPRRRSPSPHRRRSPPHRRSPSPPPRRRSPSPPLRRRSPSPPPPRRRSPSPPSRRRSPLKPRRRSPLPVWQRSPIRQKSLSPVRGRSPSSLRRRSPPRSPKHQRKSPLHSPKSRPADPSISLPQRKRSRSPESQSPSHQAHRSLSREHDTRANGNESRRYRDEQTLRRADVKKSPTIYSLERDLAERPGSKHKVPESTSRKVPISLRSPQRDIENSGDRKKMPVVSQGNSLSNSESPTDMRKVNPRTTRRSHSLSKSPVRQTSNRISRHDSPRTSKEEKYSRHDSPRTSKEEKYKSRAREISRRKTDSSRKRSKDSAKDMSLESYSPGKRESSLSPAAHGRSLRSELKKKDGRQGSDVCLPERNVQQLPTSSEELEYAPGRAREERSPRGRSHDRQQSAKLLKRDASLDRMEFNKQADDNERKHQQGGDEYDELHRGTESNTKSKKKMDKKSRLDARDSDSEDTISYRNENLEKRRHKKSDKRKRDYDETSESDSVDGKKEAKRRKKDEKRLRKEERRRRREERHRRKLERRVGKMKLKSIDTVSSPSDFEMDQGDGGDSDAGDGIRKKSLLSDVDETESERKKHEIELREKALESLRAKKAISH